MSDKRPIDKSFDDPEVRRLMEEVPLGRLWSEEARALYGEPHDTHQDVAEWLNTQGLESVLDIGSGTGGIAKTFTGRTIGLDISMSQLQSQTGPRVLANALSLPFPDESFPAVAALYMLYFFEDPRAVAAEARRVLHPGGPFVVCAPSRFDAPEFAHVLPDENSTFYSEDIPSVMEGLFEDVEINTWDFPFFDIPDCKTVADYLYSWSYPMLTPDEATARAETVEVPLKLTKRGAWAIGRRS